MSPRAAVAFLLVVAALALVQGYRHAGRRGRRRPRGHDQWRRPPVRRRARAVPGCDAYVYWPWDAAGTGPDRTGRSLYVGKALDWRERRDEGGSCHRTSSHWFRLAYPLPDVRRLASERAALDLEWSLIGELNPVYNERRPKRWVRTGRPTGQILAGFRQAREPAASRRRPARISTRASGPATSMSSTPRWRRSSPPRYSGSSHMR